MPDSISNSEDTINSRDVIARIEELRKMLDEEPENMSNDDAEELRGLSALAKEGGNRIPDWQHGETLIRYSYFKTYAQELAEDIGAIPDNAAWPCTCIPTIRRKANGSTSRTIPAASSARRFCFPKTDKPASQSGGTVAAR